MTPKLSSHAAGLAADVDSIGGRAGAARTPSRLLRAAQAPGGGHAHATFAPAGRIGRPASPRRLGRLVFDVVASVRSVVCRSLAESVTRRALTRLSDHALKDIGLSRSDIDHVAKRVTCDDDPWRVLGATKWL